MLASLQTRHRPSPLGRSSIREYAPHRLQLSHGWPLEVTPTDFYDLLLAHHRLGIVALHVLPGLHDAAVRVGGISLRGRKWLYHLGLSPPLLFACGLFFCPPLLHVLLDSLASRCRRWLRRSSRLVALPVAHPLAGRDRNGHPLQHALNMRCTSSSPGGSGWWPGPSSHQEPLVTNPRHGRTSVPLQRAPRAPSCSALKRPEVWLPVGRHHPETYFPRKRLCAWNSVDPDSRRTTGWPPSFPDRRPLHPIHHFGRLHRTPSDPSGLLHPQ